MAVYANDSGIGLAKRIIAGEITERSLVAKPADRTVNEPRVFCTKLLVTKAVRFGTPGLHRMNKDIGILGQAANNFWPARIVEVDTNTALVAVVAEIRG